jgi:hypothetical protein
MNRVIDLGLMLVASNVVYHIVRAIVRFNS